ncbi:hypothetical protein BLS_006694 [Venturia inaequalis]|uniref:NADAR domain-containing protein n=1 Tax=Venturia inaequalis TaxID=5025 RepID=A0A8H3VD80_VENIN|nr:hypothetical protein BLS_006694 [Venturia inaequalis]
MAATSDPAKHKSLGRQARGFNRAKWDENKLRIVEEGTWFKFTASKNAAELKKQLLETGEREIVESVQQANERKDREAAAEEKAALNRIVHPLKEDGKNDEDKEGNDGDEDDERGSALLEGFVGKIMV